MLAEEVRNMKPPTTERRKGSHQPISANTARNHARASPHARGRSGMTNVIVMADELVPTQEGASRHL